MSGEVVDADGHIMEPSDLWEKNIEPRYRDRALRIRKDEQGLEYMEIDGRKSKIMNGGSFGGYSGIGATLEEREAIWFKIRRYRLRGRPLPRRQGSRRAHQVDGREGNRCQRALPLHGDQLADGVP